jgi:hypothetical protein
MLNLGNNKGKIRLSLAALALVAGSFGVSQFSSLAQQRGGSRPGKDATPAPAQQTESAKERAEREEVEARMGRKDAPSATSSNSGNVTVEDVGGPANVDGRQGRPNGDYVSGRDPKLAPQVIPDDGFITVTGSTGQLDESSTALADFRNFELGFRNTAPTTTGTITARYNITAVKDAVRTVAPATNNYQFRIRFRDDDGPANNARVVAILARAGVQTGSNGGEALVAFDSNALPAIPAQIFRTATGTVCFSVPNKLDFGNYVYWLDVTISRTNPNLNANFGSAQITESETPCTPAP